MPAPPLRGERIATSVPLTIPSFRKGDAAEVERPTRWSAESLDRGRPYFLCLPWLLPPSEPFELPSLALPSLVTEFVGVTTTAAGAGTAAGARFGGAGLLAAPSTAGGPATGTEDSGEVGKRCSAL